MRVLATPKGLDIHLFPLPLSFDKHGFGRSYIGVDRFQSLLPHYYQQTHSNCVSEVTLATMGPFQKRTVEKATKMLQVGGIPTTPQQPGESTAGGKIRLHLQVQHIAAEHGFHVQEHTRAFRSSCTP